MSRIQLNNMSKKPRIIIIDGPMGSGKTTVSKMLHLQIPRSALLCWDELKWMSNDLVNNPSDKNLIKEIRIDMTKKFLKNNYTVIVEGGFGKPGRLKSYQVLARRNNTRFIHFFFTAPEHLLLKRAAARPKPAVEKKKITKAQITQNIKNHPDAEDAIVINTEKLTPQQIVQKILKNLK